MSNKQTKWTRAYNEKAYDRLAITVPKGQKLVIKEHALRKGTTINGLVNSLLQADMGFKDEEWGTKKRG